MQEHLEKHFTPSGTIVSYLKLKKLAQHQIDELEKAQKLIQDNASYYVFYEPETLKDLETLQAKIEEWQWFLDDILNDDYRINSITM